MTVELKIEGMHCEHCVGRIVRALEGVEGVTGADVRLDAGEATVRGETIDLEALIDAVDRVGYTATVR